MPNVAYSVTTLRERERKKFDIIQSDLIIFASNLKTQICN